MDGFVELIVGNSTTLDVYVIVRLCVVAMCLDFGSVVIGLLSAARGTRGK